VPLELDRVILRCLEKDPERRYENIQELACALLPFCPSRRSSVERVSHLFAAGPVAPAPSRETPAGALRSRWVAWSPWIVFPGVLATFLWLRGGNPPPPSSPPAGPASAHARPEPAAAVEAPPASAPSATEPPSLPASTALLASPSASETSPPSSAQPAARPPPRPAPRPPSADATAPERRDAPRPAGSATVAGARTNGVSRTGPVLDIHDPALEAR
jgi:hypothetical protein